MPISSTAVIGNFSPTPFLTHITKTGELIETARPPESPNSHTPIEMVTDLSTVETVPLIEKTSFYTTQFFKYFLVGLIITLICLAFFLPFLLSYVIGPESVTTATTTTTTTNAVPFWCYSNETIIGVWNTTAGGNGIISISGSNVGNYYPSQGPQYVCDDNFATGYTNFGQCVAGASALDCGINTGFYRILGRGSSLLFGFQVCTGPNLSQRDPLTVTIEGSNQPNSSLLLGSSWTLIYSGPTGLASNPGANACGPAQFFISNTVWYTSYRVLVTSKRGSESSTWYYEFQFFGL